ncbi:MAG TPA: hypothetical protein VE890_00295, partial [Thermoguttaceae bacterium]|nr:hypothetical protein [Thermoguttaceae bacterium]
MSLFRLPKFKAITSTVQRIQDRFVRHADRSVSERAYRSLQIDPLEERQLLSLAPGHIDDSLVNAGPIALHYDADTLPGATTLAGQSVAVDNDGDFVVTWTSYDSLYETDPVTGDPVTDPVTGQRIPLIDPDTGLAMTDANIFARYFTDEVQRVTLPETLGESTLPGGFGTFSLVYGGN